VVTISTTTMGLQFLGDGSTEQATATVMRHKEDQSISHEQLACLPSVPQPFMQAVSLGEFQPAAFALPAPAFLCTQPTPFHCPPNVPLLAAAPTGKHKRVQRTCRELNCPVTVSGIDITCPGSQGRMNCVQHKMCVICGRMGCLGFIDPLRCSGRRSQYL
jgi:hypothetical protein